MNAPPEKANVLIVDDRPENILSLQASLEGLGENIVTAASGEEALRRLLERDFAVILLDVQMPGMDGYETAALIRNRERLRYTPIIFLTAILASEPHVFRGYEAGAVDYLVKPISPLILRSKVASFVELFKKSEEVKRQGERLRDIERKEKEREAERADELARIVQERTAELARANRDLQTMLYVATHDLKEPLFSTQGFADLLVAHYAERLDEKGRDHLRRIHLGVERMRRLLDDLLVLARTQKIELPTEPTALDEIVSEVIEIRYAERIQEQGAKIRSIGPLPRIRIDKTWAIEAVANLVSNALKFAKKGEPPDIEIGPWEGPEGIGIAVRDRGPGVPPEMAERIFQLFQRGVGREVEGTGAGLAIVREIAERHGGKAWVRARDGGGAEFFVTFAPRPTEEGRRLDVLLVDDDLDFPVLLREYLEDSTLTRNFTTARDGMEAIEILRRKNGRTDVSAPDLVLLDINMPRMNGFEVLAAMKADPELNRIPVAILSASNRREDIEKAQAGGAISFITKPDLYRKLPEVIKRVAGASR